MRGNGLLYGIQSIMNCWSGICVATDVVTLLGYSQLKLRAERCLATVVPMGNMIYKLVRDMRGNGWRNPSWLLSIKIEDRDMLGNGHSYGEHKLLIWSGICAATDVVTLLGYFQLSLGPGDARQRFPMSLIHIWIYIYIYICVCVCVWHKSFNENSGYAR